MTIAKLLTAGQGCIAGLLEAEANAPRDVLLIRPMLEYMRDALSLKSTCQWEVETIARVLATVDPDIAAMLEATDGR